MTKCFTCKKPFKRLTSHAAMTGHIVYDTNLDREPIPLQHDEVTLNRLLNEIDRTNFEFKKAIHAFVNFTIGKPRPDLVRLRTPEQITTS